MVTLKKVAEKISKHSLGKKSDQRDGKLTFAQTRDKRHRDIIAKSMESVGAHTDWYGLKIPSQKDLYIGSMLAQLGLCVALPEKKRYVYVNGYVDKKRYRYSRGMPGYIFIGVNPGTKGLYCLYRLRILWGIIGRGGMPYRFNPKSIAKLYQRLGCGNFDGAIESHTFDSTIKVGENVTVSSGAYAGHTFNVIEIGGKFAKVTGHLFGGECKIQVPMHSLERAKD